VAAPRDRVDGGGLRAEVEAGFAALVERDLADAAARLDAGTQARLLPLARSRRATCPAPSIRCSSAARRSPPICRPGGLAGAGRPAADRHRELSQALNKNVGFPAARNSPTRRRRMTELLADLAGSPVWRQRSPRCPACRRRCWTTPNGQPSRASRGC
jgi:hypothetical protein